MAQAHNRELREKLFRLDWTSAVSTNRPILEEALKVRHRIAQIFGLPTWAHYALEIKMAGSPERVEEFYAEIVPPLRAAAEREVATLQERAERDGVTGPVRPGTGPTTTTSSHARSMASTRTWSAPTCRWSP